MAMYYAEEKQRAVERKIMLGEIVLRCSTFVCGVIAVCLIGLDSEVREIFSIEKRARFTDMKALVFLLITNGLAAGYNLVQGVRCLVGTLHGTVLRKRATLWAMFSYDQVIAYVTLSAVAAAIETGIVAEYGQPELQWMKTCDIFPKFCFRLGVGVAMAFLVFLTSAVISCISAFKLFRLYDNDS